MARPSLFNELADRIADQLKNNPEYQPSSISALARMHHVAYATMWKTVELLQHRNIICKWKGKRIARKQPDALSTNVAASDRPLYTVLKNKIHNGVYHIGTALPKYHALIKTYGASAKTLTCALKQLEQENLIYKKGTHWIVGSKKSLISHHVTLGTQFRHVMVITNHDFAAYNLFTGTFFGSFVHTFNSELQHHGLSITLVHREPPEHMGSILTWGEEAAREKIAQWGDNYAGALIFDIFPDITIYRRWAQFLSRNDTLPIVYFDYSNAGSQITRKALGLKKHFVRLITDEPGSVELALRALYTAGHRIIGSSIFYTKGYDWTQGRHDLIQRTAAKIDPAIRIVTVINSEPFWDRGTLKNDMERILSFRQTLHAFCTESKGASGNAPVKASPKSIMACTPSMKSMFDQGVTAAIASNDRVAHAYYLWCQDAHIAVPEKLSIIGFDNLPESVGFPITSVDFGFARLGYLAAHILIDDIAAPTDRNGIITGISSLCDRGSIALIK